MSYAARLTVVLFAALLCPSSARSSIIGPTADWRYLREAATEWGISDPMVADILAAGLNLNCAGGRGEGTTINGWLLSSNRTTMTTNAHGLYDKGGLARGECAVQSFADIVDSIDHQNPVTPSYVDLTTVKTGTIEPSEDNFRADRATMEIETPLAASRPLALPVIPVQVQVGDEIFVVSRRPHWMRTDIVNDKEPMIFKTTALAVFGPFEGLPGALKSDLDTRGGESGSLYFVRDAEHEGRLIPVALHQGAFEMQVNGEGVDYLPYDSKTNSSRAIILDEYFFSGLERVSE